jgi:PKHD-type hydroxylase
MPYLINRFNKNFDHFGVMRSVFVPEEIEKLLFLEKLIDLELGTVGNSNSQIQNLDKRNSTVGFIEPDHNSTWLFDKLSWFIGQANYDLFLYDIDAIETIQYTIYDSSEKQYYNWHTDSDNNANRRFQRKISGIILLTPPDEYEGGELEIVQGGQVSNPTVLRPEPGDIVFFDSRMPHRVKPVTSGVRKSIVFWVIGDRWTL